MNSTNTTAALAISFLMSMPVNAAGLAATMSSLQPAPEKETSIEAQLKRYKGQTEFLNLYQMGYSRGAERSAPAAGAPESAKDAVGQRAQQESDVYKVGKPGSKLLYLLNDYRGLQIVSFADGPEKAKILGRVESTGNYPDDMYYIEKRDQLVVLERNQYDESGQYVWSRNQSRLLTYDVSDSANPVISQKIDIEGEIADSRIVGKVLYIATSIRPNYYYYRGGNQPESELKGLVYSFYLGKDGPELIEKRELSLATSSRENMNIVEVKVDGGYKYYLVAILSENRWGWWDRQSLVEVVDITDENGVIKPLMTVSAKGSVQERSQTQIKDGTLIVTSNYVVESDRRRARIAVETFALPTDDSETISEKEFEYRKLHMERELSGISDPDDRDDKREELLKDKKLGLSGRFVQTTTGLRKMVADSTLTLGDTTGQSAQLQDVRYVDNLLYIFWVPRNQIDPFDLVDISDATKPKYIKRLQFEGWIERSIPLTFEGKNYVLGLGWEIPAENNERNQRFPKAMLFELEVDGANTQQKIVAELRMNERNFYTDFNRGDKYVEVRFTGPGEGSILFSGNARKNGEYVGGAKLVGFDIGKKSITEGSFLKGSSYWLKRVFNNAEIDMINTFSNEALATFDIDGVGSAADTAQAIQILELARNIRSYEVLDGGKLGVQIISNYSWYNRDQAKTELRLVSQDDVDAELSDIKFSLAIQGNYQSHLVDPKDGSMIIVTQTSSNTRDGDRWIYSVTNRIARVALTADGKLALLGQTEWTVDNSNGPGRNNPWRVQNITGMEVLKGGKILVFVGNEIKMLTGAAELKEIAVEGCMDESISSRRVVQPMFKMVSGKLVQTHKVIVLGPQDSDDDSDNDADNGGAISDDAVSPPNRRIPRAMPNQYSRNYMSFVSITGAKATCGKAVNIPGEPLKLTNSGYLIVDDTRILGGMNEAGANPRDAEDDEVSDSGLRASTVMDVMPRPWPGYYRSPKSMRALISLKLAADMAVLLDDYELKELYGINFHQLDDSLTFIEVKREESGGWGPWRQPNPVYETVLKNVGVDQDGDFTESRAYFSGAAERQHISLKMLKKTNNGDLIALMSTGRNLMVGKVDFNDASVAMLKLTQKNSDEEVESLALPGYYYGDSFPVSENANGTLKVILPLGYAGAKEVTVNLK